MSKKIYVRLNCDKMTAMLSKSFLLEDDACHNDKSDASNLVLAISY